MNDAAAPPAGSSGARSLPAFPARRGGPVRGRTAWGRAWTAAVEEVWPEDEPLRRGRAFARSGRLGPVTVAPGSVHAESFTGDAAHATRITLRVLSDAEWDRLCERLADRTGPAAALLEGALPAELAEAAEDAGLPLLPDHGDLDADCGCGAPEHPCAHAIGLAVQTAWLLDRDPWLLPLLRGRTREALRDDLKSELLLRAMTAITGEGQDGTTGQEDAGADVAEEPPAAEEPFTGAHELSGQEPFAGEPDEEPFPEEPPEPDGRAPRSNRAAYARDRSPLPGLPPLPGPPAGGQEPATGIEADPLDRLVADAAVRARELLAYLHGAGDDGPPPPPDEWQDTVRLAATHPDARARDRLRQAVADRAAERGLELDVDVLAEAWRTGGAAGLEVLEHPWTPGQRETARARTALAEAWSPDEEPPLVVEDNRFTFEARGLQLRLGRDGRWYGYRRQDGVWWPTGEPAADPAAATAELLAAHERHP